MSNVSFVWNSAAPLDADLTSSGASEIRSERTNLQKVLNAEHFYPEGGVSGGAHKLGSARVFVGTSSQVSSADTSGRLMWNSTTSTLVYLNSTSSTVIGGRSPIAPILGGAFGWNNSGLTTYLGIDGNNIGNFPSLVTTGIALNYAFAAPPIVTITLTTVDASSAKVYAPIVTAVGTSSFTVYWEGVGAASASTATIAWIAVGRVANP